MIFVESAISGIHRPLPSTRKGERKLAETPQPKISQKYYCLHTGERFGQVIASHEFPMVRNPFPQKSQV
uniref:Uncharacterized protein n=1 Tax=Romanomermis culicivorax TaxID=13658 RepID=A0A915I880_ROMCU